ncbi:MAG: FkbM family methyltransferase [Mucilaginibacter sp.]|uniref:FkbM family methyltransferase n=1 Tax=Mucilaginibacter sp. TaxID=1882438 RepID=UPI0034E3A77B
MGKIKRTFGFILNHPLGKRYPLKALFRFLYWQIQCNIQPSKLMIKHFVAGTRFYARKGLAGITGNIYTGLHEFNDMAFLLHFLRAEDFFFDIGANVGSYTLLASGVCKAKTIAIEASANTADLARKNINLNQLQNKVTLINAAAGAAIGKLSFSNNEDTTNHVINQNEISDNNVETVEVIKIDDITINAKPALIKVDVEGFETEVLKGMRETLQQPTLKAIVIELNGSGERYGHNDADIHQLLTFNTFKPYQYDPFKRNLTLLKSYGNANTLYCRDIDFVEKRVKTAEKFKVMGKKI